MTFGSGRATLVGALGHRHQAWVDELGTVAPAEAAWHLGWWIGADDRWRMPAREAAVRQSLLDSTPVVQTAMRVPSGDALHRVYGVAGPGEPIVVEIENASAAPFVVALVASGVSTAALEGAVVALDGRPALQAARPPSRWSRAIGTTEVEVTSGGAHSGPFVPARDRAGRLEVSLLHPVPHRATLRVVLPGRGGSVADPAALPDAAAVARGWRARVERAMTVDLPDPSLLDEVRAGACAALLRAGGSSPRPEAVAALEDWGFDDEVTAAWPRLSWRQRRAAARRPDAPATWGDVQRARAGGGGELLGALRSMLVHEAHDAVLLLADVPAAWRGAPLDVRDAPTRRGPVSFAVRWHGERPALLWQAPPGLTLRAPALDPEWSTTDPTGETLFG